MFYDSEKTKTKIIIVRVIFDILIIYRLLWDLERDFVRDRRSFDRAGLSDRERDFDRERLDECSRSCDDRLLAERLRLLKKHFFLIRTIKNTIQKYLLVITFWSMAIIFLSRTSTSTTTSTTTTWIRPKRNLHWLNF